VIANGLSQVLGMPATYTKNPRTGEIDYIQVQTELLAVSAFKQGVRRGPGRGEADIQIVIPAYLCEEHFQRALPLLPGILKVCNCCKLESSTHDMSSVFEFGASREQEVHM
jgi:hypothetical protein